MTKRRSSSVNSANQKPPEAAETGQATNKPQEPEKASKPTVERLAKDQPNPIANEPIDVESTPVEDEKADSSKLHTSASATPPAKTITESASQLAEESINPTAELEATIVELKAHLNTVQQAAAQRETELQEQVARLQSDLQAKQTQINKLQAELDQTHQLKAELEDAKKMILQLSQINAQPAPPVPTPNIQPAEPELSTTSQPVRSQPVRSAPLPPPPPKETRPTYPLAARRTERSPVARGSLPAMSSEPIEPSPKQGSKLSDTDLGWVD
jgi:hypothetical protein